VGLSLAMVEINIWYPCVMIGIITAALSVVGIYAGKYVGRKIGPRMELVGGIILIFIGFRILISHLFA
jgi:putative Mn2+ efflux pump MntP